MDTGALARRPNGVHRIAAVHYWDRSPAPPRLRLVPLDLPTGRVWLETDAGVFARLAIDPGTAILLDVAPPPPPQGDLLDLGCGYGPIAIHLATAAPDAVVWAVDVNPRALARATANAERLGLGNVRIAAPEQVPDDVQFAAIYSNPPVRIGRDRMRELVSRWIGRLQPNGAAYLVIQRHLGSDSFAAWLAGNGWEVERLASKRGYRVLQLRRAEAEPRPGGSARIA
jgi:16S rRNA (guanine1207-N2)-methyltransferase